MRRVSLAVVAVALILTSPVIAQTTPAANPSPAATTTSPLLDAERLYRAGKYTDAMLKYEEALKQNPKSGAAYEGAVRTYLSLDMVKEAWTKAQEGVKQAPEQSMTHTATGEVLFRKGKFQEAQREFVTAINANDRDARAPYGLYRVYKSASYYARAKEMLDTAHAIDPQDSDIHRSWMAYRPRKERIAWLEQEKATETDKRDRAWRHKLVEVLKAEEKSPHTCKLANKVTEAQVPLKTLMPDPQTMVGVELKVVINGKPMNLLLDTGASGILLKKGVAGGAGVVPAIEGAVAGIGDEGTLAAYAGFVDSIKIGALEFQNCTVDVTETTTRKGTQVMEDFDGIIGADVFSSYLISIDFPSARMMLKPLPHPPGAPADATTLISAGELAFDGDVHVHDRYIAPEMQSYTPFFRVGHDMLIPTKIGDAEPRLFIIDTGAMSSSISPDAAREFTSLGYDIGLRVEGLSGELKKTARAHQAVLRFSHVAQQNWNMISFDTSAISRSVGIEVSGFLGFSTLAFVQMDIDYRDGLVNVTYDPKKFRPLVRRNTELR